jgi:glycosyltransferase involved in cell wall biosynthesis
MTMNGTSISVIIITKNEAHDIAACLEAVSWAGEIIVIDSGSTDNTQSICRAHGAIVQVSEWSGYGAQKNKALALAKGEWILSIDADEIVTPQLRDEIMQITALPNEVDASVSGYKIPLKNYFHGKFLRCFSDDLKLRLFKREGAKFSDDVVHEKVIVSGKIGALKNYLIHRSWRNLEELLYKMNLYSTLGAQKLFAENKSSSFIQALGHAAWKFIKMYFVKLGILDGWVGFLMAYVNFEGTFYRYVKLIELCQQKQDEHKSH